MTNNETEMLERVRLGGIELTPEQEKEYVAMPDDLGEVEKGAAVPVGFKRCGKCGHAMKFYLFNKNAASKTNTSGSCKACQRENAKKSYAKTKSRRNYKKYYQENKERKRAHARKYYEENKERLKEKHKAYLQTAKGKKVMRRAHAKRRKALMENTGVPYTREMVIHRDSEFIGEKYPICYLCEKPIEDTSGKALHIDHVIPIVEGGLNCFTNVASTHDECNLRREKDARKLEVVQVTTVQQRAIKYMDTYPEKFED